VKDSILLKLQVLVYHVTLEPELESAPVEVSGYEVQLQSQRIGIFEIYELYFVFFLVSLP
jgi:hypothetical protein